MIKGMDLSHNDGAVQFGEAKAAGVSFVVCKASQGLGFIDPLYDQYREQASTVGMPFGAYVYWMGGVDIEAQVSHFLAVAQIRAGDLRPWLDVEDATCAYAGIDRDVIQAANAIRKAIGIYPFLYAGDAFYQQWLTACGNYMPVDIARYGASPRTQGWDLWQDTESGQLPGTPHGVDEDVYQGSLASFLAGNTVPG